MSTIFCLEWFWSKYRWSCFSNDRKSFDFSLSSASTRLFLLNRRFFFLDRTVFLVPPRCSSCVIPDFPFVASRIIHCSYWFYKHMIRNFRENNFSHQVFYVYFFLCDYYQTEPLALIFSRYRGVPAMQGARIQLGRLSAILMLNSPCQSNFVVPFLGKT